MAPDKVSLSRQELQQAVNIGFLAPQIRTFDFQPLMVVQLYLDTPLVTLADHRVKFAIKGKLDAEIFGGQVTEALPVALSGEAGLAYDAGEQVIHLEQVELEETFVDLDIALFRAMILSKFEDKLTEELQRIPLISLAQTPELQDALNRFVDKDRIRIRIEGEEVAFYSTHAHP